MKYECKQSRQYVIFRQTLWIGNAKWSHLSIPVKIMLLATGGANIWALSCTCTCRNFYRPESIFFKIFFLREVHRHVICPNPARLSWDMLQTLRSTQNQVPGMHLTTIPKIVLVPRKSHFPWWCNVPDVRILAPPDAKISYSKNQDFSEAYFHVLVSGVILRSLGRIDFGPNSKPKGRLGTPPLM